MKNIFQKKLLLPAITICIIFISSLRVYADFPVKFISKKEREARRPLQLEALQEQFAWWPTQAQPSPIKDESMGGYWWWPKETDNPKDLWGNRGYIYVYKIIKDYKEAKPGEPKKSLLIKKIIKNIKIYFDYNKSKLREDAIGILEDAANTLNKNPQADILITGNCDIRGSEKYNEKLARRRAEAVKEFMQDKGIEEERIKILSKGKLDAVTPITDIFGMQKDRNAQFMIAEVQEIAMSKEEQVPREAKLIEEGKYQEEKEENVESQVKVSTREYIVKKGDTLWIIAEKELGSGHRWQYLYELNKEKIKNSKKLKAGQKLIIPIE